MRSRVLVLFSFWCLCAAAPALLHAKARYGAEFGVGTGYRADEFGYKIQHSETGVLFASENSDGFLSTVPIGAHFKADIDSFRLYWEGLYGWLLESPTREWKGFAFIPGNINVSSDFAYKSKGDVASTQFAAGYYIDLFQSEPFICSLIPQGGYGFEWQSVSRTKPNPNPATIDEPLPVIVSEMSNSLSSARLKIRWKGPFIGGSLSLDFWRRWTVLAGYNFHWLHMKTTLKAVTLVEQPAFSLALYNDAVAKSSHAKGNEAFLQFDYKPFEHWKFSLFGKYQNYSVGRTGKIESQQRIDVSIMGTATTFTQTPTHDFPIRWSAWTVLGETSYVF